MEKLKFLFITVFTGILTACSNPSNTQTQTEPLRIGVMPTMDAITIATAYELGFFEEHNVDVELITFPSARDRDAAFQAGSIDGAAVDLIAVGLFNEGGLPVRATSVTTAHFTLVGQSQYSTLADLQNSTVMISFNTAIDFVLDRMLDNDNLPHNHIRREEVGNIPARFEMVRAGQAEAALISEPFATMASANGLSVISDTFKIEFNPFVLAFTEESIHHRNDDLRAFYAAYNQAVDFLNSNPVETYLDMIIDLIGFPEEVIDHITLPTFLRSELPSDEIVENAIDWLMDRDLISADVEMSMFLPDIDLH